MRAVRRSTDAEAELNLPPGFRFHPTDEELVLHYLSRKASHQCLPVPIIAEVDLYKYDPWQLPEKALFGNREWYFFTPRDRKYPNGSRPNRAAGSGYWKATGADKPVTPAGSARPLGIKKALVFYAGKAPKGIKTNWIMHEYRLADPNRAANSKRSGGSLRLDEWVLCRLYNKKNELEKARPPQAEEASVGETMDSFDATEDTGSDSFRTPESDVDNDVGTEHDGPAAGPAFVPAPPQAPAFARSGFMPVKEDQDWFMDLSLDDLQNPFMGFGAAPPMDLSYADSFLSGLINSPRLKQSYGGLPLPPF
ncbi:hypothetical protein Taro_041240 [Colocasia esculenta]|uniref:NAC domain-containing protein n=1 Tax=Colocasia esculenta TaxID=4460 RepID=A0A843WP96_COLES|nr:hypothetical protein [Colocasia esculenta]